MTRAPGWGSCRRVRGLGQVEAELYGEFLKSIFVPEAPRQKKWKPRGNVVVDIDEGEKYAVVAIQSDIALRSAFHLQIHPTLSLSTKSIIGFDDHWRDWLGSIRSEQYASANFFILSKAKSATPEILDQENNDLKQVAINFYLGLLLAGRFRYFDKPLLLTGAKAREELSIRQLQEINSPIIFSAVEPDDILNNKSLTRAAQLAEAIPHVWTRPLRYKRLRQILDIYLTARATADILERLHQYCRCIEGFIVPSPGDTTRKFKSRTELFIGTSHHMLMEDIYEFRSAVEHLNDHLNLLSNTREHRAKIYRWAHIAEHIARDCLVRVLTNNSLMQNFETDDTLTAFWRLDAKKRTELWGSPIDPLEAVASFDVRLLSNQDLGLASP